MIEDKDVSEEPTRRMSRQELREVLRQARRTVERDLKPAVTAMDEALERAVVR
jgi:hypothetical protein